jgi:hypothetical protein
MHFFKNRLDGFQQDIPGVSKAINNCNELRQTVDRMAKI